MILQALLKSTTRHSLHSTPDITGKSTNAAFIDVACQILNHFPGDWIPLAKFAELAIDFLELTFKRPGHEIHYD